MFANAERVIIGSFQYVDDGAAILGHLVGSYLGLVSAFSERGVPSCGLGV